MTIDWTAFGQVFVVSFGSAVTVIVLFATGVALVAADTAATAGHGSRLARTGTPTAHRAVRSPAGSSSGCASRDPSRSSRGCC